MPQIKAFRAFRYNPRHAKDLSLVLAPPYDVISPSEQEKLHNQSHFNVIRLILGKEEKTDNETNNKYTRAGEFFSRWKKEDVIRLEDKPSLYVYLQNYPEEGKVKSRLGFIATMKIDKKSILKHENTLAAPKKDRFALIKEVKANLSPIFGLFEDKTAAIQKILKNSIKRKPQIDVTIDGVRHRVYVESNPKHIAQIVRGMQKKQMFIADGHHRFEVACQFSDWMDKKNPKIGDAPWQYVMTYFSDCTNNPFKIFPTHRLIKLTNKNEDPFKVLATRGEILPVHDLESTLKILDEKPKKLDPRNYKFGIYSKEKGFFVLTLSDQLKKKVKQNPVDTLDVAVLHSMILAPSFGIKKIEKSEQIDFTRDANSAVAKVKHGEFDLAFFLKTTTLDEMLLASKKGLKMPQKSTYFYPKLLSGLVFNSFESSHD